MPLTGHGSPASMYLSAEQGRAHWAICRWQTWPECTADKDVRESLVAVDLFFLQSQV